MSCWTMYLDLFKVIVYFPHGKSTTWGIYRVCFIFGGSLSKSKFRAVFY